MEKLKQGVTMIESAKRLTFLTGAGVSVPSGIPDYRSMTGVYQGLVAPEYLLSRTCLLNEPWKFYEFAKQLYHPQAQPNIMHQKMRLLEERKNEVKIVTQNIDQLHQLAGSQQVINFHGSLYDCFCQGCGKSVSAAAYLKSDRHQGCLGQIRPNIVLYEEGLDNQVITDAIEAVAKADTIVIVGTSFKVQPFCDLLRYKNNKSQVLVVNNEAIQLAVPHTMLVTDGSHFFKQI